MLCFALRKYPCLYFVLSLIGNHAGKCSLGRFCHTPFQPHVCYIRPKSKPHPVFAGAGAYGAYGPGLPFESWPRPKQHMHDGVIGCLETSCRAGYCAVGDIMSSRAEFSRPATYLPKVPAPETHLPKLRAPESIPASLIPHSPTFLPGSIPAVSFPHRSYLRVASTTVRRSIPSISFPHRYGVLRCSLPEAYRQSHFSTPITCFNAPSR